MAPALLHLAPLALLPVAIAFLVRRGRVRVPVKGRHVFVTGGSSGIGLAIAKRAAAEGAAKVSILARSLRKLEEAREEIIRETGCADVVVYSADVRDEQAVRRAVEAAGPIDVLVCNQGVFLPRELEEQDTEEIKFTLDVNLLGNFHLIKAALPGMKSGGAASGPRSISIISSQAGQVGIYGYTAYSASKFALRGLAEALQQEVISHNIHVSLVFPPDTETPGLEQELQRRPVVTDIIASSSSGMKADEVAKKTLDGIKSASFMVTCNLEGILLALATAGMSPQRSWLRALVEVFGVGFARFLAVCIQYSWELNATYALRCGTPSDEEMVDTHDLCATCEPLKNNIQTFSEDSFQIFVSSERLLSLSSQNLEF